MHHRHTIRTRLTTGLAAAAIAASSLAALSVSPGTAHAEAVAPLDRCWGISPNIIDQPYSTARLFVSGAGPGKVTAAVRDVSTFWIFSGGYESAGRLDWHNLTTNRKGTAFDTAKIGLYVGGPTFKLNTGPGRVRVTLSAVNRNALWTIPSTACSGTLTVT